MGIRHTYIAGLETLGYMKIKDIWKCEVYGKAGVGSYYYVGAYGTLRYGRTIEKSLLCTPFTREHVATASVRKPQVFEACDAYIDKANGVDPEAILTELRARDERIARLPLRSILLHVKAWLDAQ